MTLGDIAVIATFAGIIATQVWSARRDKRDYDAAGHADVAEALAVSDATMRGLKEQNDLLRQQNAELKAGGDRREHEWRERERTWHEREKKLEARIALVETSQRQTLMMVTKMGLCAKAATCNDYDPGADIKAGGTD